MSKSYLSPDNLEGSKRGKWESRKRGRSKTDPHRPVFPGVEVPSFSISFQHQDYLNNQSLLQFSTRLSDQNIFLLLFFLVVSFESFYAKLKWRAKMSALLVFQDSL